MTVDSRIWPITSGVDPQAGLTIGGCALVALARTFGTPLYVLDELAFRNNCRHFIAAAKRAGDVQIAYAAKALLNTAIARLIAQEGLDLDVVSGGELAIAQRGGVPAARIAFHGNAKTPAELDEALGARVGSIVVDNLDELRALSGRTASLDRPQKIGLRIEPGISVDTHPHIQTGHRDSKFGLRVDQLAQASEILCRSSGLQVSALHAHLGSQLSTLQPYANALSALLDAAVRLESSVRNGLTKLVLGGGFAVAYRPDEPILDVDEGLRVLAEQLRAERSPRNLPHLTLGFEPGRAIAASAIVALYSVIATKTLSREGTTSASRFIHIDGGLGDNPRPALYGAKYEALVANRPMEEPDERVHVAGRYCESGDVLISDIVLPSPRIGDVIAVPMSGAYTMSMAGNYNQVARPAMVSVLDGRAWVIVRRETYADLMSRDIESS